MTYYSRVYRNNKVFHLSLYHLSAAGRSGIRTLKIPSFFKNCRKAGNLNTWLTITKHKNYAKHI